MYTYVYCVSCCQKLAFLIWIESANEVPVFDRSGDIPTIVAGVMWIEIRMPPVTRAVDKSAFVCDSGDSSTIKIFSVGPVRDDSANDPTG